MSFAFLVAGFLATANAGRVALAAQVELPRRRSPVISLLAGAALVTVAAGVADAMLDALAITPESFRVAAGLVLVVTGLRTIVWPWPSGPVVAVLVTPELACFAIGAAADAGIGRALGAAAIALAVVAIPAAGHLRGPFGRAAPFLAALGVVVGVALVVSGVRDV